MKLLFSRALLVSVGTFQDLPADGSSPGAGHQLTHAHSPASTSSPATPRHPRDWCQSPRTFPPGHGSGGPILPSCGGALGSRAKPGPREKSRNRALLSSGSRALLGGWNRTVCKGKPCMDTERAWWWRSIALFQSFRRHVRTYLHTVSTVNHDIVYRLWRMNAGCGRTRRGTSGKPPEQTWWEPRARGRRTCRRPWRTRRHDFSAFPWSLETVGLAQDRPVSRRADSASLLGVHLDQCGFQKHRMLHGFWYQAPWSSIPVFVVYNEDSGRLSDTTHWLPLSALGNRGLPSSRPGPCWSEPPSLHPTDRHRLTHPVGLLGELVSYIQAKHLEKHLGRKCSVEISRS